MSHDLSKVIGEEVLDSDCATAIELHNLVRGTTGTSSDDVGSTRSLLEGHGVFADLLMPDIDDGACSTAVNTLSLVTSNNGILERRTVCKNEDGISLTSLGLSLADAVGVTVPSLHATIKDTRDDRCGWQLSLALRGWEDTGGLGGRTLNGCVGWLRTTSCRGDWCSGRGWV